MQQMEKGYGALTQTSREKYLKNKKKGRKKENIKKKRYF